MASVERILALTESPSCTTAIFRITTSREIASSVELLADIRFSLSARTSRYKSGFYTYSGLDVGAA